MMKTPAFTTIDEFIASFPPEIQDILQKIRKTIRSAAPQAQEKISYGIPTFTYHGNLVHFAAYKEHIGFYPASSGVAAFADELKEYPTSKGTIRFPLSGKIPYDLIKRITQMRVTENEQRNR